MTTYTIEDLKSSTGREAGVSPWITINQDLITQFANLTGDPQWIHVDPERARKESPFGATIAHGFLTMGLLARLFMETIQVAGETRLTVNYGFNRLRFVSPVISGSRIRAHFTPAAVRDIEGGVEIAWQTQVEIENQAKPALVAEWLLRTYF
jgi:acyl dehydratase